MPPSEHDIVGLGAIAVDDMLYVDTYPPADAKVYLAGRRRQGGGNTSCGLAAAARLGSRCALLGRLGDDELSRFTREQLAAAGVDLSYLLHEPQSGPIYCVIVVSGDTGSRAIYADFTTFRPLSPSELRREWFQGAKVLLVDHLHPAAVLPAVKMAQEMGLQVVSDIERQIADFSEVCRHLDHLVCSAEFAVSRFGADTPAKACRALARCGGQRSVVVTDGPSGCYWCTPDRPDVVHLSAHKVEAADTTGCGDVFHGAFCHGLCCGWTIERTIRFANAAAAVKATRTGGWAAVPTLPEVQRMLDENPPVG
jgi:sulfofructose kinase